jgi:catechol 2,3-dioxygenase-like lactoylglutathione lyase family enzyme
LSEIALLPEARGRGLGAEALLQACRLLVDMVDAHRLQLEAYGFNHAAHRTFERAGFRREGTRRRAYWARDAWQDGVIYGILAEELAASGAEARVRGLGWLGTRTDRFAETVALFRDVLGLPVVHDTPTQVVLALPDGGLVEVFATDHPGKDHFATGPVAGLLVDDVDEARARLERAGVELLGPASYNREAGDGWAHFRGPDGYVYELVSRSR